MSLASPDAEGLYIGLMSGTSTDGVDAALVRFAHGQPPSPVAACAIPLDEALRAELLALNTPGADELHRSALASQALARAYAQAVQILLSGADVDPGQVRAIGAHGQTVRHRPELGYTIQLNAPALLAELAGIAVVSDFRPRDVAAQGQGAPLAPAFHRAIFQADTPSVVLNLGGIANITVLAPDMPVIGFDTGPANVLMDLWCHRHLGAAYDADGAWAATGQVNTDLLTHLIKSEPWLSKPPPKSTGRDLFNADWLDTRLANFGRTHALTTALLAQDVQATLCALTASTVAQAIAGAGARPERIWVCGGGARNPVLMRALEDATGVPVRATDELGVPAQYVEAYAFAWLAYAHCAGLPGNLPAVTGALAARVLGHFTPAG